MRRMVVLVFVLLGILACQGFSQTSAAATSGTQNLRDCMDGFGTCDRSLLTNTQAAQIADLQHDQNLRACLSGYGECNRSALTAGESKEVATFEQRRNALTCETTTGGCEKSLLAPWCLLGNTFFGFSPLRSMGVRALQTRRRIHWLRAVQRFPGS